MGSRRDTTSAAHERTAEVTRFADIKADRERREREDLQRGLVAAADAIYEWTRPRQDVRLAIIAMYGDPYAGVEDRTDTGRSVPVEAQFISLDEAKPLTDGNGGISRSRRCVPPPSRSIARSASGCRSLISSKISRRPPRAGMREAEARHAALMDALGGDRPAARDARQGRGAPSTTKAPRVCRAFVCHAPIEDSNLHGAIAPQGPQPCASTNSATRRVTGASQHSGRVVLTTSA